VTALTLSRAPRRPALPVPVVLGVREGPRIVLHPLFLTGTALYAVLVYTTAQDRGARGAFELVTDGPTFFSGVLAYFAAHAVASRDRRAHSGELLAAAPTAAAGRVAGLCIGALVPGAVCAVYVLSLHAWNLGRDVYVVVPSPWHLAQAPLTLLGAALLGTMVARLTRVPGAALLVMVAMIVVCMWLDGRPRLRTLSPFTVWPVWTEEGAWAGLHPGSAPWHAGYLLSLCAMAATGAFLREARNRSRVLYVGGAFTAAAVVTGLLQLP
jgi:hypothetical protein